jgi:hypothetical protein
MRVAGFRPPPLKDSAPDEGEQVSCIARLFAYGLILGCLELEWESGGQPLAIESDYDHFFADLRGRE